jgi:hypothetical protein
MTLNTQLTHTEKLEYIIATLDDMKNIFGIEDDMLERSLVHAQSLINTNSKVEAVK